ncbi:MAG: hypothetical protein PWQ82_42 [Thermosediminibacterales bacterium]|nr:hypothetical protein [Thermosediminibacterales bacterium]
MVIGIQPGQLVYSKAGRDKDRYFLVVGRLDEQHVLIADGDLRKARKPKKKKIKHLKIFDLVSEQINDKIKNGKKVDDKEIKAAIEALIEKE